MKLDKSLAFQVVNTIKDTCGQDINFIDKQGMIFASTNADRIGTFHAIGHKAAQTEQTIEVFSDDDFPGTQKGINMPLYYHGSFLAVIGITGEPDQVRQYVHLADRITHLLIREKELNRLSRSLEDKKHFVIDALIRNEIADPDYLDTCLSDLQVNPGTKKRLLIIQSSPDGHNNSSSLEQKIIGLFGTLGITLYTFYYPNEYLAVLENSGQLTVFPWTAQQPPTAEQLGLGLEDDVTLPMVIINDGRVIHRNLTACGRDENWLRKQLSREKASSPREIFLLTLDEQGQVFCVRKERES